MNELVKTLTFVAIAIVLSATVVISSLVASRLGGTSIEEFSDQGKPFFPDFTDPAACTSLQVVDVDPATATARPFKVMLKNGLWIIPSHYDYPADAKDRLAQTASRVIGLTKDTIRSSRTEDHKELGVIDPLDTKLTSAEGVGKRITLRDQSDRVLADYIIGKEVKDHVNQRYVRIPGQPRTYGVVVKAEPSTRFADWIETNLLKLDASKLRLVEFDNTKVDVSRGEIIQGEKYPIERKDASAPWTTPGLPPNQEVDPAKTSSLTSTLADLKIAGVRPKPPGLTAELKSSGGDKGIRLDPASMLSLQRKGFYFTRDGQFISNEGGLLANNEDGIVYFLRFGEVTFAQGEALEVGKDEDKEKPKDAKKEAAKKEDGSVESRYLFVMVRFDEKLIAKPVEPSTSGEMPVEPFQRTGEEIREAEAKFQSDKAEYDRKITEGKTRAAELTSRFAAWYYVVPGDAYRNLVLEKKALVHDKPPESPTPPPGGGFPLPGGTNPFGGRMPRPSPH